MIARGRKARMVFGGSLAFLLLAIAPASASALCFGEVATITGTGAGETLTGTVGDDVIEAGAGNDIVNGGGGVDRICGEGDDDTINGQGGNDQLDGGTNTATGDTVTFVDITVGQGPSLTVDLVAGTAVAGNPINTTDTLTGFENVTGSSTFDLIFGDAGPNVFDGLSSPDAFTGRGGNDTFTDITDSADFQDTARYPDASGAIQADLGVGTVVTPNVGTDTLTGVPGVDGTSFNDTFTGDANMNVFTGLGGDDQFTPLGGGDNVTGGAGTADTIVYASEGAFQMDMTDFTPPNVTTATGDDTVDTVENVTGSPQGDTITGDPNLNRFDGLGGDDIMDGGGGADTASFATLAQSVDANLQAGTSTGQGSDALTNFENLTGSSQNDLLTGSAGDNALDGGTGGTDTASFAGLPTAVNANLAAGTASGQGSDTLTNLDNLTGSSQNDILTGAAGDNVLQGGPGGTDTASFAGVAAGVAANLVAGTATGQGSDTLSSIDNLTGSSQDDTLTGDGGDNAYNGGTGGTDTASWSGIAAATNASLMTGTAGGQGSDTLTGIENLTGSSLGDTLIGDGVSNVLLGLAGADNLTGGGLPDTLLPGAGMDVVAASDGFTDTIDCNNEGPDSGTVDGPAPAETYVDCDTDGDARVDFLDSCPTQPAATPDGCLAPTPLPQLGGATRNPQCDVLLAKLRKARERKRVADTKAQRARARAVIRTIRGKLEKLGC